MKVSVTLHPYVKGPPPNIMEVDFYEAPEIAAAETELFELTLWLACDDHLGGYRPWGEPSRYLVHIDDLAALGHAAELRHSRLRMEK